MALNALFTGASGLAANSTALDVVGNNLANLNTTGFKTQRALFQDAVYQTLSAGSASSGTSGGSNPVQMGFGVNIGSVDTLFKQGTLNPSTSPLDMAINGQGFLQVANGTATSYTRSGSFKVDDGGFLVDSSTGARVQRFGSIGETGANAFQTAGDSSIRIPFGVGIPGTATSNVTVSGNLNALMPVGNTHTIPVQIYDSQSAVRQLTFTFQKTAVNTYAISNVSLPNGGTATVPPGTTVTFNTSAQLIGPASFNISLTNLVSASDQTVTIKLGSPGTLGGLTQFGDTSATDSNSFPSNASATSQDGIASGTLSTVSVDLSGVIQGSFSNGKILPLAQLALAGFNNEAGLIRQGNNYFSTSASSGNPLIGPAGSGGLGTVQGGALEGSNVDIATEFAKLIIAQRGFQVNAQTVTAANEMLQQISNIIR